MDSVFVTGVDRRTYGKSRRRLTREVGPGFELVSGGVVFTGRHTGSRHRDSTVGESSSEGTYTSTDYCF